MKKAGRIALFIVSTLFILTPSISIADATSTCQWGITGIQGQESTFYAISFFKNATNDGDMRDIGVSVNTASSAINTWVSGLNANTLVSNNGAGAISPMLTERCVSSDSGSSGGGSGDINVSVNATATVATSSTSPLFIDWTQPDVFFLFLCFIIGAWWIVWFLHKK